MRASPFLHRRGFTGLALVASLATACGAPLPGEEDAGAEADAGFAVDAGAGSDAGADDAGAPSDGGRLDAGSLDGGPSDAGAPDAGVADAGRQVLVYPVGRLHSPLTPEVAAHLRAVAARGPTLKADVFAKVGDSNTVNTNYLACFAGANVDLDGRAALQPTLQAFRAGVAGSTTPFNRVSQAATVGWSAGAALAGAPSPLDAEVAAVSPRFATVMFGTNDVGFQDPYAFGRNLFAIADRLLAQGVVPVFTAVPRRLDSAAADAWVPRYNLVARGVAQARRFPFVDLHQALEAVPSHGLGGDGVHLNVYAPSGARGCVLTAQGLGYGHNTRNLLSLEALARARGAVLGEAAPDATGPVRTGDGTVAFAHRHRPAALRGRARHPRGRRAPRGPLPRLRVDGRRVGPRGVVPPRAGAGGHRAGVGGVAAGRRRRRAPAVGPRRRAGVPVAP